MSISAIAANAIQAVSPTVSAPPAAGAPTSSEPATPQASGSTTTTAAIVYSSPTQSFDPSTGSVVVETRNTSTGVVESQTPGTAALQYERSQMLAAEKAETQGHHAKTS